uniref:Syntaxin-18 n=1 Tax=Petromyzon marinus TaxID=7757 RepID=A0AAJ7WKI8_PETMA|nr:syntaxin-18 [Petromyzon marinus]
MATNLTAAFRASVKAIRSRERALLAHAEPAGGPPEEAAAAAAAAQAKGEASLLARGRPRGDFAVRARDVAGNITKLRDFLMQHRKAYLSANSLVTDGKPDSMTDADRDNIDRDAQTYMRTCAESIHALKVHAESQVSLVQARLHRQAVLGLLESYLRAVCRIYSEQRAIRVKRVVDRKRLERLEPDCAERTTARRRRRGSLRSPSPPPLPTRPNGEAVDTSGGVTHAEDTSTSSTSSATTSSTATSSMSTAGRVQGVFPVESGELSAYDDGDLTAEEIQMFHRENDRLLEEMSSLMGEVRQIEGKVVEISRLQEIFTDKVLQQERDIDLVHSTVVGTTENIKEGNEEIREAMKNNAGFRVWILFFLTMCSFSLLFLDWYGG